MVIFKYKINKWHFSNVTSTQGLFISQNIMLWLKYQYYIYNNSQQSLHLLVVHVQGSINYQSYALETERLLKKHHYFHIMRQSFITKLYIKWCTMIWHGICSRTFSIAADKKIKLNYKEEKSLCIYICLFVQFFLSPFIYLLTYIPIYPLFVCHYWSIMCPFIYYLVKLTNILHYI